jgi:hypothetical protein
MGTNDGGCVERRIRVMRGDISSQVEYQALRHSVDFIAGDGRLKPLSARENASMDARCC